jgi:hypothetical protein
MAMSAPNGGRRRLPLLAVGAAGLCIAELLWLRTTPLTVNRPQLAILFLPWLAAATINLALWHQALPRARPLTTVGRFAVALFWITSTAFALWFTALYAALLFGWL